MSDLDTLQRLHIRAAFFRLIRQFFWKQGFIEVDTPIRQPVLIPERYIRPIKAGAGFLQASPELSMKRLLARGCERIFQICPCFRQGEQGRLHSEEFLLLEWYRRDSDYHQLMQDCEALVTFIAEKLQCFSGTAILQLPWQRLTVEDAFRRYAPQPLAEALVSKQFDEIVVEYIEPHLGIDTPVFLYDYPTEMASLARKKQSDPRYAERFELYIGGVEIANGFSELADPVEQRQRFYKEIVAIKELWEEVTVMPDEFLNELPAMGDAAGIALGVERLLMLVCGAESIADVKVDC